MESRGDKVMYVANTDYSLAAEGVRDVVTRYDVDPLLWTVPPAEYTVIQHHGPDPNLLRGQFQPPQAQQPNQDYLMYPQTQQFTLLNSSNSEGQSGASSWFTSEAILCSLMPGVIPSSEAFSVQDINFDKATLDSNHLLQPIYNADQSGQVVLLNSEPEPVFATLENAPVNRNNSFCQDEGVGTFPLHFHADRELELLYSGQNTNNAIAFPVVYNQGACALDSREPPDDSCHYTSTPQAVPVSVRTPCAPRSRKTCHCTKSLCLKLYCECFSGGVMCNNCPCKNCHNNTEHEAEREKAIKNCLVRNPHALGPKISDGKNPAIKGRHCKGCNCKRSRCLKNYCECYEANIRCTPTCKCIDCGNGDADLVDKTSNKNASVVSRGPSSVITPAMVEGVVVSLLARAEEAEREQRCEASAQNMILNEFGRCIREIGQAMFKTNTY